MHYVPAVYNAGVDDKSLKKKGGGETVAIARNIKSTIFFKLFNHIITIPLKFGHALARITIIR